MAVIHSLDEATCASGLKGIGCVYSVNAQQTRGKATAAHHDSSPGTALPVSHAGTVLLLMFCRTLRQRGRVSDATGTHYSSLALELQDCREALRSASRSP